MTFIKQLFADYSLEGYMNFNSPIKSPPKKSNYYNRVYLCFEKPHGLGKQYDCFHCFNCIRFNDFIEADEYYAKREQPNKKALDLTRSTMIPVCKYFPSWFDIYILNYKLKKQFWSVKNYIIDPYPIQKIK